MSEEDKRPQNLIVAQADKFRGNDPASAPEMQATRPLPEPPRINDPFPNSGDIYSMVRSLVMSALSNSLTIDGRSPDISQGTINFNTNSRESAADQFAKLNKPDTKAEVREKVINDHTASLEQRLFTPGLDSNPVRQKETPHENEPKNNLGLLSRPIGIRRGGYAGLGQKARVKGPSKIRQSEKNHTTKDPTIPAKTELPNKVVEHDTTRDSKAFIRCLFTRADGEVSTLVNLDTSSSAPVTGPDDLPAPDTFYNLGKNLDLHMKSAFLNHTDFSWSFTDIGSLCWRGGLFVGSFATGSEPAGIDIQSMDVISSIGGS